MNCPMGKPDAALSGEKGSDLDPVSKFHKQLKSEIVMSISPTGGEEVTKGLRDFGISGQNQT